MDSGFTNFTDADETSPLNPFHRQPVSDFSEINGPITREISIPPDVRQAQRLGELFADTSVRLVLILPDGPVLVKVNDELIIGWTLPTLPDYTPDVDLAAHNAQALGVSRHHLKIVRDGYLFRAEDMGSTNGTLLNGTPLAPRQARLLRDGDCLTLGQLPIQIKFEKDTP